MRAGRVVTWFVVMVAVVVSSETIASTPAPVTVQHRVVWQPTYVHAEPSKRSRRRGQLAAHQPFVVHAIQPAADCPGEGWGTVEQGGYVCLERAGASEGPARVLPAVPEGWHVPFIYAKPRVLDRKTKAIARVPRYRDLRAWKKDEPGELLAADRQYIFVEARKKKMKWLLIDTIGRVVPAKGMKVEQPSKFTGRDLTAEPIPAGLHAAWSVGRPAVLRARPGRTAAQVGTRAYHATLNLAPTPIVVPGDEDLWYAVPDGAGPGKLAYASAKDVNFWIPGSPLPEAGADALWIDVELRQQTLAVMRGQSPVFVTLISSGASGYATPVGLYRIYEKLAAWTMRSSPTAGDPYFVEGVPWIQYFHRRYALHTAYWHDDFGKRRSHGCVNLSPRDAAAVYALTTPQVPAGWNSLVEHAGAAGTLVRVRKGTDPVPDRRLPLGVIEEEGDEPAADEAP